ncbi:hypothetical protein E4U56_006659 [Claviceps arundinis]|uniref:Spindle pole body-associated protein cut12 domain-containing protein n=1 Tax=Claviceps arundinis TaxID=1623583 RepID=A0A9P7MVI7_9HYPO|nr:hypothetical protein E4U56_006659 [Claviceps arundinis]
MLGWMLKRGEHAPESGDGDTTHIDQPDTPAPVFAARAFKSALFGTPSKRSQGRRRSQAQPSSSKMGGSGTPSKPQGILLTPGTGASKRKRVTFGRDVPGGSTLSLDRITELDESIDADFARDAGSRPEDVSDDEWEEEDEGEDEDEDEGPGSRDVTVDLNEPHSQSGRYWKEEFLKYHQEARAEMEKLLKYKQLAKTYAQQKDAEAIQLAERLRDEQQRVIKMEKKIADNASQLAERRQQSSESKEVTDLLDKLNKQSTLATQYRHRVQDLEAQMEELRKQRVNAATGSETPRRRYASSPSVSTTQERLTETRRELRRARGQLKELDSLRDEVFDLKMQLRKAQVQIAVHEKEEARATSSGPRTQELRALLKAAKEESRRKDDQLGQLKLDFEAYMKDSDARDADTKSVLERAQAKITELKKEVKSLKGTGSGAGRGASRPHSWHPSTAEDKNAPIKETRSDELLMRDSVKAQDPERRSLEEPGEMTRRAQRRTLREKFREDAAAAAAAPTPSPAVKPRWQPFVPRSPRNRRLFPDDVVKRPGIVPPELPVLSKSVHRDRVSGATGSASTAVEKGQIDLLSDQFTRLGGPGPNNHLNSSMAVNTSKGSLPPERRAAALAKIDRDMAERRKVRARKSAAGKENIRL